MLSGSSDISSKRITAICIVFLIFIVVFYSVYNGKDIQQNAFLILSQLIVLSGLLFGLTSYEKKINK